MLRPRGVRRKIRERWLIQAPYRAALCDPRMGGAVKSNERRVTTLNANQPGPGPRISEERYNAMRDAILDAVPFTDRGIPVPDLQLLVEPQLSKQLFRGASVAWYLATVKLDLEAREVIERVPGSKPQRVRRKGH